MKIVKLNQKAPASGEFITEKTLLERVPVSRRTMFNWRREGKIPEVRIGRKRVLFHWQSVQAALLRFQRGGIQWN